MIGIYGIFRKVDDKCMYVGESADIDGRIKKHLSGKSHLSFNKDEYYGEMLEQHFINDKQYRFERETYWIKELNPEYNKQKTGNYSTWIKGKHQSETVKKKISVAKIGKHKTDETKKKISEHHADVSGKNNPSYGKRWINNGEVNKYVKQDELDKYIKDGWKLGRLAWKRNL